MTFRGRFLDVTLLAVLSLVWTGGFISIQISDGTIPPFTLIAMRSLIAGGTLLLLCVLLRRPLGQAPPWHPAYLIPAVLLVDLPWPMLAQSEHQIDAGLVTLLTTVTPMATFAVCAWVLHTDHSRWYRLLGMALCVAGLALAIGVRHLLEAQADWAGLGLTVGAFVCYALNGIALARVAKGLDPLVTSAYGIGYGAVLVTVAAFVVEDPLAVSPSTKDLWAMLFLAVPSTAGGYAIYYYLVARSGAFFASMWGYLVPAFGVLASAWLVGAPLDASRLIGAALVIGGVVLVNRKARAGRQKTAQGS